MVRRTDDPDRYFTVGLFSALDALLERPLEHLLGELPLGDEVNSALLRHEGPMGATLACVLAYERAAWNEVRLVGVRGDDILAAYLDAVEWARGASRLA